LLRRQQGELQVLASFLALRLFLATQNVLHERRLVRRRTVTAPKGIEEGITVFQKKWGKDVSSLGDLHACGNVSGSAA